VLRSDLFRLGLSNSATSSPLLCPEPTCMLARDSMEAIILSSSLGMNDIITLLKSFTNDVTIPSPKYVSLKGLLS
jgi:hypothetical protein